MKTLLLVVTFFPLVLGAAENPPPKDASNFRQLLQEGLFEEEANRDLEKAATAYETLASQYDSQRALAATAIYHLAEIRARQGRQAAAVALYQRVLTEFPAMETLAKLSRERLTAVGAAVPPAATAATTAPTQEEADELARIREMAKNSPDLLNSAQDELPLNRAAGQGWLEVARFLLDHGAKVDGIPRVQPPLYTAAAAGRKAVVELLLDRGATLEKTPTDHNPLQVACNNGHAEVARLLLDRGADANTASAQGFTALHAATIADRVDLVQLLLEYGANPNVECRIAQGATLPATEQAGTPLELAATGGSEPIVKILLAYHADPNLAPADAYNSSLITAIGRGNSPMVEELIAAGAKLEPPAGSNYISPLCQAASPPWHPELVRLLLDRGASPVSRTQIGQTAMQYSLNFGGLPQPTDAVRLREVWEALLEKGTDVNAVDNDGRSVLHRAMAWKELPVEMVGWLIEHGADPNLRDKLGNLPAEHAQGARRLAIEEHYVFPKLAKPRTVLVAFRIVGAAVGGALPKVVETESETLPDLGAVLHHALAPLLSPASQGPPRAGVVRVINVNPQEPMLPSEFDAIILRASTLKGPLAEIARIPLSTSEPPNRAAWPQLQWGDVVVLYKESASGGSNYISTIRRWIEQLGGSPEAAVGDGPPFVIRAVAGADYADAEDFTMNRGKIVQSVRLERTTLLDRAALLSASVGHTTDGKPSLLLTFTPEGARELGNVTTLYRGKQLGVIVNGQLLAAPVVRDTITGGTLEITGEFEEARAQKLVELLNAAIAKGDFVTAPGHREFLFAGTSLTVDVRVQKGGFLSWSVNSANRSAGSGADSKMAPDSGWFIVPESAERVWVYNGTGSLLRVEFNGENVKFADVSAESPDFKAVPTATAERYQRAQKSRAGHP